MKFYQNINFLSITLFVLLQSSIIVCMEDDENFVKGNHFFTKGRYDLACDAYQKVENKGFSTLYNLGLSYLNQADRAQAIVWTKRAEKHANFKELTELYDLFDCMNRQLDSDYELSWSEQFAIFFKKCILSVSMLLLQILLLLAIMLVIYCYHKRFLIRGKKILGVLFLYSLLAGIWWYKNQLMQQKIGIIIKKNIDVLAGPDTSFYKKVELHECDEVKIVKSQPGYYQIQVEQVVGWIHDKDIELV